MRIITYIDAGWSTSAYLKQCREEAQGSCGAGNIKEEENDDDEEEEDLTLRLGPLGRAPYMLFAAWYDRQPEWPRLSFPQRFEETHLTSI